MKKLRLLSGRGTKIIEGEFEESIWAGEKYQESQIKATICLPKELSLSRRKGTGFLKIKEYPEIRKMSSRKGLAVITGRGTGIRYL